MGKKKSLFYQFQSSINDSESGHKKFVDKHSQKSQTEQESQPWRIYSFSAKSNLLDTAHNLSGYLKEQYGISKVKEISSDMCQSWLDHCAKSGCSIATLECYKSNLKKLSHVINRHFGLHTDFSTTVKHELVTDKTSPREFALSKEEIEMVKASIVKYAKVLDMTDSGRDIKPLVTGMFEMVDRLKVLEARDSELKAETPLFEILKAASE